MRYFCFLVILFSLTLPTFGEWPNSGNAKLDKMLSTAKDADHEKAFAIYNEALKINPRCAEIYAERAIHFEKSGQYQKALQDCDEALKLHHDDAVTYETRARVYLQTGKYEEAITAADKSSTIANHFDELDNDHLRVIGASLYHLGKYKEALVPLTAGLCHARTKNPSADALYYRALCYDKLNQNEKALRDLNAAIKKAPARSEYYTARAKVFRRLGCEKQSKLDDKQSHLLPSQRHVLFY